jgi:hypothetical protein
VGVDHRRGHVAVAEELLDGADVVAVLFDSTARNERKRDTSVAPISAGWRLSWNRT